LILLASLFALSACSGGTGLGAIFGGEEDPSAEAGAAVEAAAEEEPPREGVTFILTSDGRLVREGEQVIAQQQVPTVDRVWIDQTMHGGILRAETTMPDSGHRAAKLIVPLDPDEEGVLHVEFVASSPRAPGPERQRMIAAEFIKSQLLRRTRVISVEGAATSRVIQLR